MLASRRARCYSVLIPVAAVAACGHSATLTVADGTGPTPQLPPPRTSLIPTVKVSEAKGWPRPASIRPPCRARPSPRSRTGSTIRAGCTCCRTATCSSPRRTRRAGPDDAKGIKGWVMKHYMKKAGAARAEREPHHAAARRRRRWRRRIAHGVARRAAPRRSAWRSSDNDLYVANTDAVVRFPYTPGANADRRAPACQVADLPAGPINHHWTKNIIASRRWHEALRDRRLEQQRRARTASTTKKGAPRSGRSISTTGNHRIFASGLRNPDRHGVGADDRRAVDVRQRTRRARQRPRARLHDLGARRRLLRLALQLLRPARRSRASSRRRPDLVAKAHRAGLRARAAHRVARPCVVADRARCLPRVVARRDVRRPARLVESQAAAAATR